MLTLYHMWKYAYFSSSSIHTGSFSTYVKSTAEVETPKRKFYIKRHPKVLNFEVFEAALRLARLEAYHIPIFPNDQDW